MIKTRAILSSKPAIRFCQLRHLSQLAARQKENTDERMQAWQIHSYGSLDELKLSTVKIPVLSRPSDILIKVEAASVNPIDVAMIGKVSSNYANKYDE